MITLVEDIINLSHLDEGVENMKKEQVNLLEAANDIAILSAAGIGVAMGNSADDVKAAADFVTTDVDNHGIAHALRHYKIID